MSGYGEPMPGKSPRLRLELQLTEAEIEKLKRRADADGRSGGNYIARLVTLALRSKRKQFRPMPNRSTRGAYNIALPLQFLDREALRARAAEEGRTMSGCVTRVIVASLAR